MRRVHAPPWSWVFGAATAFAVFSFVQTYRLSLLNSRPGVPIDAGKLLALSLCFWYFPALVMPSIVATARAFPFEAGRRWRAVAVHSVGALLFSLAHLSAMIGVRFLLWEHGRKSANATWGQYIQQRSFEQLDLSLMVYAGIVGASHALGYYHELQERNLNAARLETRLAEARLKMLEAQLHPHFLFNTLHAVSTLVHRDPQAAERMLGRLSDLLRFTLERTAEPTVSLEDEMDFLQKYLDIEQTRFQDRLTLRVDVAPEALAGEVPRMILQPLVENAIKHGMTAARTGNQIHVTAGVQGDRLWLRVSDNGTGLGARTLTALRTGVGLSNTRARLDCLYSGHYRLEFSDNQGGLSVLVEIPFKCARATLPAAAGLDRRAD